MEKLTLEQAMSKLDEIVKRLEKNEDDLETSIQLFKEGMDLSKQCNEQLTTFEKQVLEIIRSDQEVSENEYNGRRN